MTNLMLETNLTKHYGGFVPFPIVFFFVLLLQVQAHAQTVSAHLSQIEKGDFPAIKLYIDVVDAANRPVEKLLKSDFQVFEDGKSVEVSSFADPSTPRSLVTILVLDRSGSMKEAGKIGGLKAAAASYIRAMKAIDSVGIIAFHHSVEEMQPITSRRDLLLSALETLQAGGQTAFYDAVYKAIRVVGRLAGRKVVLAMTDGIDNKSSKSLEGAINLATKYGVPVYTVGLGVRGKETTAEDGIDEVGLRHLADQTGGLYFHAPSAGELVRIYELLSHRFHASYELTYMSPRQIQDGTTRNIMAFVALNGLSLTTGHSYYVPGVIVPSADTHLFVALLIPLLMLVCAPTVLQRYGRVIRPVLQGWGSGLAQHGKAVIKRAKEVYPSAPAAIPGQVGNARLILIRAGQTTDIIFPLGLRVVIGRSSSSGEPIDIDFSQIPEGTYVSRQHAELYRGAALQWYIKDIGSRSGTFAKKPGGQFEKITGEQTLQSGDEVAFGNARFRFEISG